MKKFLATLALAVSLASVGGPIVLASDSDDFTSHSITIVQIPFTFTSSGTVDSTGIATTVDAVTGSAATGNTDSVADIASTAVIGSLGGTDYGSK